MGATFTLRHRAQPGDDLLQPGSPPLAPGRGSDLYGSLPSGWQPDERGTAGQRFREMDKLLDLARSGPVWLKETRVAEVVAGTLRQDHLDARYRLSAYVVMSNHVHVLLEPLTPVARLTNWVKGVTARQARTNPTAS